MQGPELPTLFAPTDEAFARLDVNDQKRFMGAEGRELLSRHVVRAMVKEADLNRTTQVKTLDGQTIEVERGERLSVGGAALNGPEVACTNGMVHPVGAILR